MSETHGAKVGYPAPPIVVDITPAMAFKWVDGGTEVGINTHNRPIQQARVDRYARDMKAGNWLLTHQGIAFSKDGRLIDGQHRLWAIIESGVTVPMLVHHGLEMATQTVIDTADARSMKDRLYLADKFGEVKMIEATTLRYLLGKSGGRGGRRFTVGEEQDAFTKYRVGIRFVVGAFPPCVAKIRRSPVTAAITRAYYAGEERDKISAFCHALATGEIVLVEDRTVRALRDTLLQGCTAAEAYFKTSSALRSYFDGKALTRIYAAPRDVFIVDGLNVGYTNVPSRRLHTSQTDLIMAFMREHRETTVADYLLTRKLSKEQTGSVKPAFDDCVKRGWLSAMTRPGRRGTLYTLIPTPKKLK